MTNNVVYVHAGTFVQFQEYQRQNPEYNCIYLVDENTIRGRCAGKVVRIGNFRDKWNDQAIEESIQRHLDKYQASQNQSDIDYGIE